MSSPALKHIFNELQYELTNKLAEGGMGLVYEAIQKGTGNFRKIVAIKLIREEYSSIPEFQKNFIARLLILGNSLIFSFRNRLITLSKLQTFVVKLYSFFNCLSIEKTSSIQELHSFVRCCLVPPSTTIYDLPFLTFSKYW